MFKDDGVRNHNQIQGVDTEGNLKNIKVNENGEMMTSGSTSIAGVNPTEDGKLPVDIGERVITTLMCDIATVEIEATSVEINKKVTKIELANYSDTAKVTVNVGSKSMVIGSNLVVELLFNEDITTMELSSTEEGVEVQYLVEGEE